MLVILILLFGLMLGAQAEVSQELREKLDRAEKKMRIVQTIANGMAADDNTRPYVGGGGTSIRKKAETFGKKWIEAAKLEYRNDPEGNAEKIGGAITGVGEGVIGFVNGIKNNDWKGGVKGALSIISSVVALAGPVGVIASSVLSMISSLFDLFGGSQETESMDDKIERIVAEQINIGRAKDLQADFEGLKVAYQSLSASIQHFRESEKLEEEQANELYNHAFLELPIFGKIQAMVNEICDDVQDTKDKFKEANKCLGTIQRYAEASILRQLLLTNMASLMADVYNRTHGEYVKGTGVGNDGGLLIVSNNVLNLIKKEQEKDRTKLRFLADPFNHPSRRYVIGVFFSNSYKYPTLRTYLRSLDKDDKGIIFKKYAMFCKENDLLGDCISFEEGEYPDLNVNPTGWRNVISSFFLPRGLQLTAWLYPNFKKRSVGPYAGPTVHLRLFKHDDYDSLKIVKTERDADNEVLFCEQARMEIGICDSAPAGEYNLKDYNGRNWEKKYRSMHIPLGLSVHGYVQPNQEGSPYSFYRGPFTANLVFNENNWKSISVAVYNGDAKEDAEVCDAVNFGGHCIVTGISSNQLKEHGGTNFEGKVRSLRIPGGMHVTGYTEIDHKGAKLGPYKGPAVITRVDLPTLWKSMQITKLAQRKTPERSAMKIYGRYFVN